MRSLKCLVGLHRWSDYYERFNEKEDGTIEESHHRWCTRCPARQRRFGTIIGFTQWEPDYFVVTDNTKTGRIS